MSFEHSVLDTCKKQTDPFWRVWVFCFCIVETPKHLSTVLQLCISRKHIQHNKPSKRNVWVLLGGGGVQSKHRWVSDTEQGPPMSPAATLAPGWLHSLLCQMRAELFKYLSSRIQISNISKIIVHIFAIFLALTLIEKNITHYYWLNISLMTDFMFYSKRGGMKS